MDPTTMGSPFIHWLADFEIRLTHLSFLFYLVDQSLVLINCALLILIILKTPLREKKQLLWVLPILALSALVASLLPGSGHDKNVAVRETILLLLPFVETLVLFKKPHIGKFFAAVFVYGLLADTFIYLLCGFLGLLEIAEHTIELGAELLLLIVLLIAYVVPFNKRNSADKLSYLDVVTFLWVCLTVIVFVLTIEILDYEKGDSAYAWIIPVNALMFLSLVVYVINSMLKARQSEAYFRRALDAEIRQFEIIGEKDEDLRRFRHDYANHMRCISAMIEDGQEDDVKAYVEKLGVDLQNTTRDFYSGNYMLDIILAEKRSVAGRDGNDVLFEGSFPKNGIKNDDICTIMANALDNAIEACRALTAPCEIRVKSIIKEDQVAVSITNPVAAKAHIIAGSVATSKADKSRHGYGLKSIKKTVEKYDGYMQLSSDQDTFELFFNLKFISEATR